VNPLLKTPPGHWLQDMRASLLLFLVMAVFLTGCMTQEAQIRSGDEQLSDVTSWTAQGKMSYDLSGKRGNFSFRWIQANRDFEIVLFGPLGISAATITGNEVSARIETSEGQVLTAPGPEQLLRDTLGLEMPVTAMIHWLRGVPKNNGAPHKVTGSTVTAPETFAEAGWQVAVLRRDKSLNPSRIRISKPGASLLVIVKNWSY